MFTGIITELGQVELIEKKTSLTRLGVSAKLIFKDTNISDSIAVNGVCLTVTDKKQDLLFFEAINPTLKVSNLKRLVKKSFVNLEGALKVGDKLGGHFVLGHVDNEVKLRRNIQHKDYVICEISYPCVDKKFVIKNGSITLDGVSLTIKEVYPQYFTVNIIPYTWQNTNFKLHKPGNWLNIEYDYLLKGYKLQV